ncbi:SGNH/GDSL hydrolase family protein [Providencia rettgeri]|uniref:SGNH/GDSL hydrolase family protein n=1 Tax=Providencia rettgeri TaxID=587 RepID=UPI002360FCA4|nr:SGNH/GDSL hydrolase family protein [Providencia rettgeri]
MTVINIPNVIVVGNEVTEGSTFPSPTPTVKTNKTLQYYMARMAAGEEVKIACYGDSTTDGVGTTGWERNPITDKNEAIGDSNHESRALNAWPKKLQDILRDMYSNENIHVYNAGYSGKTLADGWALSNFPVAITNNPNYGVCDIVFVDFGLNDIPTAGSQLNETVEQTNLLIDEIEKTGALPVLLTSGPAYRSDSSGRGKNEMLLEINTMKKDIAAQRNIPLIDKSHMLTEWLEHNSHLIRWVDAEPDGLHFGDIGHQAQASLIAAELYGGVVNVNSDVQHLPFMDNRVNSRFGYSEQYVTGTSKFHNLLLNATTINKYTGQALLTIWLRVRSASAGVLYNTVRNENVSDSNKLNTTLTDVSRNTVLINGASPNQGFATPSIAGETGIAPIFLGGVTCGLHKIQVHFPTKTVSASIFWGYLSVYPQWKSLPSGTQNVRSLTPIYHQVSTVTGTRELFPSPLKSDGSNFWGLGFGNTRSTLYFKASITKAGAIGIMLFNGVQATTKLEHRCLVLFRNTDNSLEVLTVTRDVSGVSANGTLDVKFSCGALKDDDEHEYKFVLERNSEGASLKFYQGYASTTPLTEITAKEGEVFPFPMGGAFGSTWSYKGNTSVKVSEAFVLEEKL